MPERTCSVDGCCAPHRARGLCSTHYNQQHLPERRWPTVVIACTWCGREHRKAATRRHGARFCSLSCRDTWRRRDRLPVLYVGADVLPDIEGWTPRRRRAERKLERAMAGQSATLWAAGRCRRCGEHFVSRVINSLGRYCSDLCKRRDGRSRRRAAERSVTHVAYSRQGIFERDKWRCHICRRKTDQTKAVPHLNAPTIDHLIPLAAGGDDTAANVATACFRCNSGKGPRGGGEQLALL